MRLGLVKGPLLHISNYLDVMPLCTFQKKQDKSLIVSQKKCIFVGYKDGVKGCKLWNPTTKTIVYIRDVILK